jgi:hypothetical protein
MRGIQVKAGQRLGSVVTVGLDTPAADGHARWKCRCDCGVECTLQSNVLKRSKHASCGCKVSQLIADSSTKHGYHGTSTYSSWRAAIYRCHNGESKDFHKYGARGIQVCQRWRDSFEAFLADMGERPDGTTIDRYPNKDGNYEPGNCRWATPSEQARNRHSSLSVQWKGESRHLGDVAAELGISYRAAHSRHQRGTLDASH